MTHPEPQPQSQVSGFQSPELTAIILAYNEAAHITDCIQSLNWVDRILVFVDSHSDDETATLAEAAGAEIGLSKFENYAQQRNAALDSICTDWVFFVDADERGTPKLGAEIRHVIAERPERGWEVPRHNYIFDKLTLGAGWYPDYQARLFKYGQVRYERPVHELAVVNGDIGQLENPLIHYNYRDVAHFHATQQKYTDYDAGILYQDGIHPKPQNYVLQPWRQFWWRFVTLNGYKNGAHGLHLSLLMGYYEWVKYRKLRRLWHEEAKLQSGKVAK
jgi:glycosyltransferase involved in cell wall biosynthesis